MPKEWSQALIHPVHKKGSTQNPENYRPISPLNVTYKLLAKVINKRIQENIEEKIGQYQAGFGNGKSVINHIFAPRQIEEKCCKRNIPIHALFLDFKQAFDKINRKNLIEAMQSLNIPTELVQLVKMTLVETTNKISYQGQLSAGFTSNSGL
ncbi:hypothetical protein ILUMI_00590 [Ignelater luminosus]|uniref:Reverse transcriptase domain-containing protein n=1 Tax=Ignelater luminosus TaxID=2038154 RepID=A0A8K0DLL0_IGNLU|nr:hypothetical protein ILUMI_00590 [Ignelater luminosus]